MRFGSFIVPLTKYSTYPKLGTWVATQRYQGKLYQEGTPSHMTVERIRKLDGVLGFVWKPTIWKNGFNNCVNTRCNPVTSACQSSILKPPSWGSGF